MDKSTLVELDDHVDNVICELDLHANVTVLTSLWKKTGEIKPQA